MNGNDSEINFIRLDTAFFNGSTERVFKLPGPASRQRLTDLVQGRQITASADGQTVVLIQSDGPNREVLVHNRLPLPRVAFEATSAGYPGTRIIQVSEQGLLLWGKPIKKGKRGVYRFLAGRYRLVERLDELMEIRCDGSSMVILGRRKDDHPGIIRALTSFGTLAVTRDTIVSPQSNGMVQVIEKIDDQYCRYLLNASGVTDLLMLPTLPDEQPIGIARLQDLEVLCLSGEKVSRFVGLGKLGPLYGDHGISTVEGRLECVWQSPKGRSIAALVRQTKDGLVKRTLLLNGQPVYEGSFSMRAEDLRWSPNEMYVGARISPLQTGRFQEIVTSQSRMILDTGLLNDFLIDDEGSLAARLMLVDGMYTPFVYNVKHDTVPFAWNLVWFDGQVRFNSVNHTAVLATNDATHKRDSSTEH